MQGGDDLEDDFVPDETVALSGDEGFGTAAHLEDEDIFLDPGDNEGQDGEDEDEAEDVLPSPTNNGDLEAIAKKRKRREKEKERKAKVRSSQTSFIFFFNANYDLCKQKRKLMQNIEAVEGSITARPPHELSKYLDTMQAKCFPDLSVVEMDDLRIPGMQSARQNTCSKSN